METNKFTLKLEEIGNADMTFQLASSQTEQKAILVATGDFPDIFFGNVKKFEQLKWGAEGILIPLNDLIEEYGPNIKAQMERDPLYKSGITAPDGNIYLIPQINECYHCSFSSRAYINQSWLDQVGMDIPKTTDEFFNVLMAFKDHNFDGVDNSSKLIMTGMQDSWRTDPYMFLMNPFVYTDMVHFLIVENGEVKSAANQPDWKLGLQWINSLYANGLLDENAFGANNDNVNRVIQTNERSAVGVITTGGMNSHIEPADPKYRDYVVIPPLKGPNGKQYATKYFGVTEEGLAITSNTSMEQRIAAMKMADYTFTEMGSVENFYGEEGDYWEKAPAGTPGVLGHEAKYIFSNAVYDAGANQNVSWSGLGTFAMTKELRFSTVAPEDPYLPEGVELLLSLGAQAYDGYEAKELFPQSHFTPEELVDEWAQLQVQIVDYIKASFVEFALGRKNFDNDYQSYLDGLNNLGLNRYLEIAQMIYDGASQ